MGHFKKTLIVITLFCYLFSLKSIHMILLKPLEINNYEVYENCKSIVVIGGRDDYDRILKGLEISQYNLEAIVVFSGVHTKYQSVVSSFKLHHVVFETNSTSTYENAMYTSKILQKHNINDLCLVTSQAHLYRAEKVFQTFGLSSVPIVSNKVSTRLSSSSFLPDLKYFALNISVVYEYLAIISYKIHKRI